MTYGATMCAGLTGGYSGILLHQLRSNSSDLQIDDNMASWIVSVYTGGTSLGCISCGIIMNLAGRRTGAQTANVTMAIGWLVIAFSNSIPIMLVGRAIDGFGKGAIAVAATIHLDEMADPRLRVSLFTCCLLTYSIGIVIITSLGTTVGWRISAGIGVAFSLLDFIGYCFVPESPVWLVRSGKTQKAREVFKWLWKHQHDEKAERDLEELLNRLKEETQERQLPWKLKFRAQFMKPLLIVHVINLLPIFCGMFIVIFYASDIMSELNKMGDLDLNAMLVSASVVRMVAMILIWFFLLRFGRRPLCILSGTVAGLAALGIAVATSVNVFHAWLLFVLLLTYIAFSTFGLLTVLPVLSSELMPSKIRCVACGYIYTLCDLLLFGFTKAFPFVVGAIGMPGLFSVFAGSCLLCSCFLYFFFARNEGPYVGRNRGVLFTKESLVVKTKVVMLIYQLSP
ncbi:hypothetical protein C0J52_00753 [Blattella germanica]|nr:hypothetical protein C0J52_00753 [Blattella germanica]